MLPNRLLQVSELLFAYFAKRNIAKFIKTDLLNSLERSYYMFFMPEIVGRTYSFEIIITLPPGHYLNY